MNGPYSETINSRFTRPFYIYTVHSLPYNLFRLKLTTRFSSANERPVTILIHERCTKSHEAFCAFPGLVTSTNPNDHNSKFPIVTISFACWYYLVILHLTSCLVKTEVVAYANSLSGSTRAGLATMAIIPWNRAEICNFHNSTKVLAQLVSVAWRPSWFS